jgi:predicted PurR-regulated permease PerM
MVPFFLIYMLKDHEKFIPAIGKFFKGERIPVKLSLIDFIVELIFAVTSLGNLSI